MFTFRAEPIHVRNAESKRKKINGRKEGKKRKAGKSSLPSHRPTK